jgi:hypothetical protein
LHLLALGRNQPCGGSRMNGQFALLSIVYMMGFVYLFDRMHYRHKLRVPNLISTEELDRIQAIWFACQDT